MMTTRRVVLAGWWVVACAACDGGGAHEASEGRSEGASVESRSGAITAAAIDVAPARNLDVAALPAFGWSTWSSTGGVTDGAAALGARFGRTVSVFGDWVAVTRQALTASDLGTTQAFHRTSTGWTRAFTFTTPVDRFPVAAVGSNWLAIGEPCGSPSASCHGRVKLAGGKDVLADVQEERAAERGQPEPKAADALLRTVRGERAAVDEVRVVPEGDARLVADQARVHPGPGVLAVVDGPHPKNGRRERRGAETRLMGRVIRTTGGDWDGPAGPTRCRRQS
jgi:hypothetical protein